MTIPRYRDGHAWVVDGYNQTTGCYENGLSYSYIYYYMNWGWNGGENGWFGCGDFTPAGYNFNYKSGAVVGIKP